MIRTRETATLSQSSAGDDEDEAALEWASVARGAYGVVTLTRVQFANASTRYQVAVKWTALFPTEANAEGGDMTLEASRDEALVAFMLGQLGHMSRSGTRSAPSFLETYASYVFKASFAHIVDGENLDASFPTLLKDDIDPSLAYTMLLQEFASEGSLRDLCFTGDALFINRATQSVATAYAFELLWSLMVAYGRPGLLYHGDLKSNNILLTRREHTVRDAEGTSWVTFRLLDHSPANLDLLQPKETVMGYWAHRVADTRPVFVDFGFASFLAPTFSDHVNPDDEAAIDTSRVPASESSDLASLFPPELLFGEHATRDWRSDLWQMGIIFITLFGRVPASVRELRAPPGSIFSLFADEGTEQALNALRFKVEEIAYLPRTLIDALAQGQGFTVNDRLAVATPLIPPEQPALARQSTRAQLTNPDVLRVQMFSAEVFIELLLSPEVRNSVTSLRPDAMRAFFREFTSKETWRRQLATRRMAEFLDIALLKSALGHDWRPNVERYASHPFYQLLQHSLVERFMTTVVLNPGLPLFRLAKEVVETVPADARALIASMLAWDRKMREPISTLLQAPLFTQALAAPPKLDAYVLYSAHNLPPAMPVSAGVVRNAFERERREWLARRHEEVAAKYFHHEREETLDAYEDIEEALVQSIPRIRKGNKRQK